METGQQDHGRSGGSPTGRGLSEQQIGALLQGIDTRRVRERDGLKHLEGWDVRARLIQIFGIGGFDDEAIEDTCLGARNPGTTDTPMWIVGYRAKVRLTVRDPAGNVVCRYTASACFENEPKAGQTITAAHHNALTSAQTLALKRAATDLGDQFGLSLYNSGSPHPVVGYSLAQPEDYLALIGSAVTLEGLNRAGIRLKSAADAGMVDEATFHEAVAAGGARRERLLADVADGTAAPFWIEPETLTPAALTRQIADARSVSDLGRVAVAINIAAKDLDDAQADALRTAHAARHAELADTARAS